MYVCRCCGGRGEYQVITELDGITTMYYLCGICIKQKKTYSVDFLTDLFSFPATAGGLQ